VDPVPATVLSSNGTGAEAVPKEDGLIEGYSVWELAQFSTASNKNLTTILVMFDYVFKMLNLMICS
jgi:hypothetical protein